MSEEFPETTVGRVREIILLRDQVERLTTALNEVTLAAFYAGVDVDAILANEWADACVLVLPCGRSAHLELGWAIGQGKRTAILHHPAQEVEPELMAKMVDGQFNSIGAVIGWLATALQRQKS